MANAWLRLWHDMPNDPKWRTIARVTGYKNFNREAFHKAEEELKREGHTVLNPAVLPDGLTQPHYMDICMAMIRCMDAIYMLKGWQRSAGAKAELALAEKLGHAVIFQEKTQ